MSDSKQLIVKKQKLNLERANKWLRRARLDFNAFKRMVPFDKNTRNGVRCLDPALAVYLLQQSIEKATKSVAAATGKYTDRRLRSHGHNSLKVLLDFYLENLNTITKRRSLNDIGKGLGVDFQEGLPNILHLIEEVSKNPEERKDGEILFREQFAMANDAQIGKMLDLILLLRGSAFIGIPKSMFGPHGKITIDGQKLNTDNPEAFVASAFKQLGEKLHIQQLPEDKRKIMEDMVRLLAPNGIANESIQDKIVVDRPTEDQLGQWSLIALLILAMYTFPHESSSRYPSPSVKKNNVGPLGFEDYNESLGIVSRLGQIGYLTQLALDSIGTELEAIAIFYPIVESKFREVDERISPK